MFSHFLFLPVCVLESEEIRTELISVMLQPELLPIFSGHKEIPETPGMCTKIEQMNPYSFYFIPVSVLGNIVLNGWADISSLTDMHFHRFQMPPQITMLLLDFNSPH